MKNVGIVTARDRLTIQFTSAEIWAVVEDFVALHPEEAREKYKLGDDAQEWRVERAQNDLRGGKGPSKRKVVPIQYRPFDVRATYYTGQSAGFMGRPRPDVMTHLLGKQNIALHVCRQLVSDAYQHASVTSLITDDCYVSNKSSERGYTIPLYVNPPATLLPDDRPRNPHGQVCNLNPSVVKDLENVFGKRLVVSDAEASPETFMPEDVFGYAYVLLYSPVYRERHSDLLRRDFPRIPFTRDFDLFMNLASLGRRLVEIHTNLKNVSPDSVTYPVAGTNIVESGYPILADTDFESGSLLASLRVYINKSQYFHGIHADEWEFEMGSYQPCEKWLKDRRGRCTLSHSELNHYRSMVVGIKETIAIMGQIDQAVPKWPLD